MAKGLSAAQAADKWTANAGKAGSDYLKGVQAMTANPMEAAAASQDKYAQGCAEAAANNRFADGCRSVSLSTLKDIAEKKGAAAYTRGVTAMRPEKKARLVEAINTSKQVGESVAGMSTMTLEERIAKSAEYIRRRAEARNSRR